MTPFSWLPVRGLAPNPSQARSWLRDELHGGSYQQSWLDSVIQWLVDHVRSLLDSANRAAGSRVSLAVTVLLALAIIALLVWVLPRVRRESAVARPDGAVLDDLTITPGTYRSRAARALAEGRYDDAVLDGFRAIAKNMSERTLLDDAPGRTAREVSLAVGRSFPDRAGGLTQAADVFDAVRYGHRRATADQANQVRALDSELASARPLLATAVPHELSV